ncbi:MAG: c-type cytochrome [Gemmatimonadota bacterium]
MRRTARMASVMAVGLISAGSTLGGWATITVEELPDYFVAGQATALTFTVRQHGVSPMDDLRPVVEAVAADGKVSARAVLKGRGARGTYTAPLTLPAKGEWTVTIRSGFGESRLVLAPIMAYGTVAEARALPAVERGRRLFIAKSCASCHEHAGARAADKAMGVDAPALTGRTWPADYLARQMTDPARVAAENRKENRMPRVELGSADVDAISLFINQR